ncbi:MAG: hypothetical protein KF813_09670, partial [Trueperaceae bacterium]|nr:hypothetical protein [Trueperaceae bacterium]
LGSNPTQRQIDLLPSDMPLPEADADEVALETKPPAKLKTPLLSGVDTEALLALQPRGGSARKGRGKAKDAPAPAPAPEPQKAPAPEPQKAPPARTDKKRRRRLVFG